MWDATQGNVFGSYPGDLIKWNSQLEYFNLINIFSFFHSSLPAVCGIKQMVPRFKACAQINSNIGGKFRNIECYASQMIIFYELNYFPL